jgi:hypothetical protein
MVTRNPLRRRGVFLLLVCGGGGDTVWRFCRKTVRVLEQVLSVNPARQRGKTARIFDLRAKIHIYFQGVNAGFQTWRGVSWPSLSQPWKVVLRNPCYFGLAQAGH